MTHKKQHVIYSPTFVRNICIAIARRRIPKTFRNALVAAGGSFFSRKGVLFNTTKITMRLMTIPAMMAVISKDERNDNIVVNVPAPASNGNAIGTMLPEFEPSLLSPLKKFMPSTISRPIKKMINEPASANELTSIPKTFRIVTPKNRKATISMPAVNVAVMA